MTLRLGAVADDYTGASDLANTLSRNGLRTVQTIGVPRASLALPDADAIVVALKSRSVAPEHAVAWSRDAADWLATRGAQHLVFKICSTFDSTDRGNIGPVTDALRAARGAEPVIVTPAFPETGRTVFQGHLFVGALPLDESPLKDHPLNPMRDANLVRVLGRQSAHPVGLLPLATVEAGVAAVRNALASARAAGVGALIADAVAERHLLVLGEAALGSTLSVGASGLGLGLARALAGAAKPDRDGAAFAVASERRDGPAAIVAGSCSAATLAQIAAVENTMPVFRLGSDRFRAEGDAVASAVADAVSWARARLDRGPVLIASSAPPGERSDDPATGARIEHALALIVEQLVASGVTRLVVAGGETSGAAVDRLGIEAFAVGPEIAPGVPALLAAGARHAGLAMALKSGNFGGDDFFVRALGML